MQLLKERIKNEGKILPGNIVKVDGFLNHRVDTQLMAEIAKEFKRRFAGKEVTMEFTLRDADIYSFRFGKGGALP